MKNKSFTYNFVATVFLIKKEIQKIRNDFSYNIISTTISTGLYLLIFGELVGNNMKSFSEVSYMSFITPGIIMMSVVTSSFITTSSLLYQAKTQSYLDEMIISPLSFYSLLNTYLFLGLLKGYFSAFIVIFTALLVKGLWPANFPLLCAYIFITSALFSLLGFYAALTCKSVVVLSNIQNYFFTPFILLGGIYYSIDNISALWRFITLLNPGYYLVNLFRFSVTGLDEFGSNKVATLIFALLLLIALFFITLNKLTRYEK